MNTFKDLIYEAAKRFLNAIESGNYTITRITKYVCDLNIIIDNQSFNISIWIANPDIKFELYPSDSKESVFVYFSFTPQEEYEDITQEEYEDITFEERFNYTGYSILKSFYHKELKESQLNELIAEKQRIEEQIRSIENVI